MTPRLLAYIASAALGFALASLVVGTPTMFGTALATAMGFGIGADLMRRCER